MQELKDKSPKPLLWYPNKLAYTFNECSRAEMRANPLFKVNIISLHNFPRISINS